MNWLFLILYLVWHKSQAANSKQISTTKANTSMSTFKTSIIRNDIDSVTAPAWSHDNSDTLLLSQFQNTQQPSMIDFTEIKLNYQNKKFYFFSILFLFLIMPVGIFLWCLKKLIKLGLKKFCLNCVWDRVVSSSNKEQQEQVLRSTIVSGSKNSDSALSGECGCVFRIQNSKLRNKNKETMTNCDEDASIGKGQHYFVLKNYFFSTNSCQKNLLANNLPQNLKIVEPNFQMLESAKSACVLITFKNSEPNANKVCLNWSNQKLFQFNRNERYQATSSCCLDDKNRAPKFQSEEDLSDYMEYTQNSLLDIRNRLNFLDKV